MLLSCEGSHHQKKCAPQPEAVSKQPRYGDRKTGKREFSDGENRKGERQRRQETNRTAVRSVPITQAGDRGISPDFGKPHRGKCHGRRSFCSALYGH